MNLLSLHRKSESSLLKHLSCQHLGVQKYLDDLGGQMNLEHEHQIS